jgi:L-threonylcarbamoyladenylate synthase
VKGRPSFDPLIVHLADARDLPRVAASVPDAAVLLAARFWPGPLTLVLPKQPAVPDLVTAGLDTVGVRVPDHAAARALIEASQQPIAAPSANPFGYVSPTRAEHVAEQLGGHVDIVLDGGPCSVGIESTILSLVGKQPALLRPGAVTREELEAVLGSTIAVAATAGERPLAPGQLPRHYATRTPLRLLAYEGAAPPAAPRPAGLLAVRHAPDADYAAIEVLAPDGSLATAAASLFAALRRLDAAGLDVLFAEPVPEKGIGRAVMDRLRKCAAGGAA